MNTQINTAAVQALAVQKELTKTFLLPSKREKLVLELVILLKQNPDLLKLIG